MSTSDLRRALVVSVVCGACLALIANPSDPAMSSLPIHPMWAIAMLLAARYGADGLLGIPTLLAALIVCDWISGGTGAAALARASNPGDLSMAVVAVAVSLMGASHEKRKALLTRRLAAAEERAARAEAAADQLGDAALALRDRCDRSETSLQFLADVAVRMEDPDPTGAGQAALELAMARTGAGAGFVQLLDDAGRLRTLTARGRWSSETFFPPALFRDLTALTALDRATAVAAHEVSGVRAEDSDLVAPLIAPNGRKLGVLALRRVPYTKLGGAARQDLVAVARWAAGAMARNMERLPPASVPRVVETRHAAT